MKIKALILAIGLLVFSNLLMAKDIVIGEGLREMQTATCRNFDVVEADARDRVVKYLTRVNDGIKAAVVQGEFILAQSLRQTRENLRDELRAIDEHSDAVLRKCYPLQ